ncbi:MAG: hypothetical protein Q9162_006791 [Coniocarpon cinnabarinum]
MADDLQHPRRDPPVESAAQTSPAPDHISRPRPEIAHQDSVRTMPSAQSSRLSETSQVPGSQEPQSPATSRSQRPLPRRPSARNLPRRGQEFSVDDASQEIEQERQHVLTRRNTSSNNRAPSTVRRRQTAQPPRLPFIHAPEEDEEDHFSPPQRSATAEPAAGTLSRRTTFEGRSKSANETREEPHPEDQHEASGDDDDDETPVDEDADLSDAESFTLKDRQDAINETHPFGIRIWKPALYKKGRSVEKEAEGDIHSAPGGRVNAWLSLFNWLWTLVFGWWLALIAGVGGSLCLLLGFVPGCMDYGHLLCGFAFYIFYPFGKYVSLIHEEAYAHEDEGEARSISEYERWQQGDLEEGRLFFGPVRSIIGRHRSQDDSDDETSSLLGHEHGGNATNDSAPARKARLFGRGKWTAGRIVYFILFYGLLAIPLLLVAGICWLLVFTLPMARVTAYLFKHLRQRPLSLEFHDESTYTRRKDAAPSAIILCTYRAVGLKYWKYTVDGTNIFLINLLGVVAFVIFDYWVLFNAMGLDIAITNNIFIFLLALFSIVPLAYFIGQAVASISAQSSMGLGAAINAFFSTVVEVFLYCVALHEGKPKIVEGSIIGSIFAGILFLPGISMCFGAIKRKTQRFNQRSAGVTSTMLLFAVIGAFSPTLFYQIYGAHEMSCHQCKDEMGAPLDRDCRRCFFAQIPAVRDPFYQNAIRPYSWFASVLLFLSYIIGLWFTLRTHAATIWNTELEEREKEKRLQAQLPPFNKPSSLDYGAMGATAPNTPKPPQLSPANPVSRADIRDSHLYKRILNQALQQAGMQPSPSPAPTVDGSIKSIDTIRPPEPSPEQQQSRLTPENVRSRQPSLQMSSLTDSDAARLAQYVAEMAATAATVAARDATQNPRKASFLAKSSATAPPSTTQTPALPQQGAQTPAPDLAASAVAEQPAAGGHDAPNWGRTKSYTILLTATIAYAIIAEILVNTVDAVLASVDIDQKFLGITLFALVPNTTEFLNAISFAMNGNIALSMEIGSAYALQVCLLQIPALVLFSAIYAQKLGDPVVAVEHTFTLLFPQWDMVTVILCVFLLSYMYGEGKSNYFKGSILILSYLVVVTGFALAGRNEVDVENPNEVFMSFYRPPLMGSGGTGMGGGAGAGGVGGMAQQRVDL